MCALAIQKPIWPIPDFGGPSRLSPAGVLNQVLVESALRPSVWKILPNLIRVMPGARSPRLSGRSRDSPKTEWPGFR
jgi:hypothetical protein